MLPKYSFDKETGTLTVTANAETLLDEELAKEFWEHLKLSIALNCQKYPDESGFKVADVELIKEKAVAEALQLMRSLGGKARAAKIRAEKRAKADARRAEAKKENK
jgi:hypothetical protein